MLRYQMSQATQNATQHSLYEEFQSGPILDISIFFHIYNAVTPAVLPGAVILTLAAGALFGLATGTIIASVASTIGANTT